MTKTTQSRSPAIVNNGSKESTINRPETEENIVLMRSALDSLNNLYEELNKLYYVIKRKNMELNRHRQNKGEPK